LTSVGGTAGRPDAFVKKSPNIWPDPVFLSK
jgi:hypothetical protein